MDDFFSFISKAVIIIPIIIIILSFVFKFNRPNNSLPSSNNIYEGQSRLTPTIMIKNNSFKLDLNGSFVCQYENEKQKYYLSVKNKKINLKITEDSQIKEYDLSSYAPMIQTMFNLDIDRLETMAKPYLPQGVDLETLLKSCK